MFLVVVAATVPLARINAGQRLRHPIRYVDAEQRRRVGPPYATQRQDVAHLPSQPRVPW